jgi:hypothetical protein
MEVDLTSSSAGEILPLKRSTDILPGARPNASKFLSRNPKQLHLVRGTEIQGIHEVCIELETICKKS